MRRRTIVQAAAGFGMAGILAPLTSMAWASGNRAFGNAQSDPEVTPSMVQFRPEIEPLVRLIELTPREKCLEMAGQQLRKGTSYRQLLAALYLAGIRNVSPQPPGFKFHCVFVIHAAHQLSLNASGENRLLPLLWALDNFKQSQEQDASQGDFRLPAVPVNLPSPANAWREFHAAMDEWNEERADRAIVALTRSCGAMEIAEGLWQYGARDYRNIGHKAIFVANTWRTLQTIGWQHAEPTLRSLVLGLLDFGRDERVNDYTMADQSWLTNLELTQRHAGRLPENWTTSGTDVSATRELLQTFRSAGVIESCSASVSALQKGHVTATGIWDAAHLLAGELMMRQPGIFGIHTVTSLNGLHYAWETASSANTRLLMLLQGVGWMCQFQKFMAGQGDGLRDVRITDLPEDKSEPASVSQIFELIGSDVTQAATKAMSIASDSAQSGVFTQTACRLIFSKATDAHDYKYAAAVFEDLERVSPVWRPQMLATAVYHLRASGAPDTPLMLQAAEMIQGLR